MLIVLTLIVLGILFLMFIGWIIFTGTQSKVLPPFEPIPPTTVIVGKNGDLLIPPGKDFVNVIYTDDYPSIESEIIIYTDLEIVPIGDTQDLITVYDLESVKGNDTSIFSNFKGTAGIKPILVYYFVQNGDSYDKIIINITDETWIRPGYKYIMYFTVAIASDQVNYSTLYNSTFYEYITFFNTKSSGIGCIKGTVINQRNSNLQERESQSVRERLLSVFRTSVMERQSHQLISMTIDINVPLNVNTDTFNTIGQVMTVSGKTEFVASLPCQ